MTRSWTYEAAASFWKSARHDPEAVWADFEAAEQRLLDHIPRSAAEAAQMLEVLVDQGGDRRSDGRDVEAMVRVHRFLTQQAPGGVRALRDVA